MPYKFLHHMPILQRLLKVFIAFNSIPGICNLSKALHIHKLSSVKLLNIKRTQKSRFKRTCVIELCKAYE